MYQRLAVAAALMLVACSGSEDMNSNNGGADAGWDLAADGTDSSDAGRDVAQDDGLVDMRSQDRGPDLPPPTWEKCEPLANDEATCVAAGCLYYEAVYYGVGTLGEGCTLEADMRPTCLAFSSPSMGQALITVVRPASEDGGEEAIVLPDVHNDDQMDGGWRSCQAIPAQELAMHPGCECNYPF